MKKHLRMALAWLAAAACVAALAGCGGSDGPDLSAEVALLEELVASQQQQITTLEAAREEEPEEPEEAAPTPTVRPTLATQAGTPDTTDVVTLPDQPPLTPTTPSTPGTGTGTGTTGTTGTGTTVRRSTTQTAEATQRAENFRDALSATTGSPVDITVPTRGSLRLMSNGYNDATLGGSGIRGTTMNLISGDGKTAVYTDRELNRQVLRHYGTSRDTTDDTRLLFNGAVGTVAELSASPVITQPATGATNVMWRISHGIRTSLAGGHVDDDDDPATPSSNDDTDPTTTDPLVRPADPTGPTARASYSGSLHGVPGTFVCGATNCEIQLTPTYAGSANDEGTSFPLQSVTLTGPDGLFFKPSSATSTIPLFQGGPVGVDDQYMVFGYWREDPASPAGLYRFQAFAQAFPAPLTGTTPTGVYDGIAVGGYAEKDATAAVETWRQGEFAADLFLEADGANVTGTIDDFVVTPTGGSSAPKTADRWRVTLGSTGATDVQLTLLPGTTTGTWESQFVATHGTAATGTQAPAVTGTFTAMIPDSVTLAGAFGGHLRQ